MNAVRQHWQQRSDACPLVAWRDAQLQAIGAAIGVGLQGWRAGWGLAGSVAGTSASAHDTSAALEGEFIGGCEGRGAWLVRAPTAPAALVRILFGDDAVPGPVALEVQQSCAADLVRRLREALQLADEPVAPAGAGLWSGTVQVSCAWGDALVLNAACARWLLAQQGQGRDPRTNAAVEGAAVLPLQHALAGARVPLAVALGHCEIALGALQDLQVGDVLRVDHALESPALVQDGTGHALFAGHLVRRHGRKAVELVPLS